MSQEQFSSVELRAILSTGNAVDLNTALEEIHPTDIAQASLELDNQELLSLVTQTAIPISAEILAHMPRPRQLEAISLLDPAIAADLLESMRSDDRVDLIQEIGEEKRAEILHLMDEHERRDVMRLSMYPEGTAGSVMSTDVTTLKITFRVDQAISWLREMAEMNETIYYNYVVDENSKLAGIVSLRDLILAKPEAPLSEIMNQELVTVSAKDNTEDVARIFGRYDLLALPVVDLNDRLVGIVTIDDVLDFAQDEATDDIHKLGATGLGKESLKDASGWLLYRRRIVWLMVLVGVNLVSGAAIAFFENTIQSIVALVFFLPLLIGSGGNAGSQSATLMVRALATGEVILSDWFKMLAKEVLIALGLGCTMAIGVAAVSVVRAPEVLVVVVPTMVLVVLVGSLFGLLLPFLLTKLKLDPATASGPLITSIADIAGVVIYLSLATWLLQESIRTG